MTAPSLTNGTILNTETSDVTKLTANDNDLLNAIKDGTKTLTFGEIVLSNSPGVLTNLLPTDASYDLGSTTYGWKALYLDNAATDGGSLYFDGSNASFLKSDADGTGLKIGGFDELSPNVAAITDLGNASTPYKYLYLNNSTTDGGGIIFDGGSASSKYLKANASGTTLSTDLLILGPNGTVGAPGIAFINEADCGLYVIGTNNIGLGVNGAKVLDIGTGGLGVTGDIYTTALTDISANVTGFASFINNSTIYKKSGKSVDVEFKMSGDSNATSITITGLPAAAAYTWRQMAIIVDNGGSPAAALTGMDSGGSTLTIYKDMNGGAFTASGNKQANGHFHYEAAS